MDERLTDVLVSHTCSQFILLALLCQLSPLLLSSLSPSFTLCPTILVLSPVRALPPHPPSPHQPSLLRRPLQSVLPSSRTLPFLACHSRLDIWQASICLQVTHQSLTPNKHHLVASLRQPGQQPPLPVFVNVFHLERSPLVHVLPGSPGPP